VHGPPTFHWPIPCLGRRERRERRERRGTRGTRRTTRRRTRRTRRKNTKAHNTNQCPHPTTYSFNTPH
jgi:hypothetical protein